MAFALSAIIVRKAEVLRDVLQQILRILQPHLPQLQVLVEKHPGIHIVVSSRQDPLRSGVDWNRYIEQAINLRYCVDQDRRLDQHLGACRTDGARYKRFYFSTV